MRSSSRCTFGDFHPIVLYCFGRFSFCLVSLSHLLCCILNEIPAKSDVLLLRSSTESMAAADIIIVDTSAHLQYQKGTERIERVLDSWCKDLRVKVVVNFANKCPFIFAFVDKAVCLVNNPIFTESNL